MSKKILIITSQFPPYTISIGGVIRVFSFIQSLKNTNKVYVISGKTKYYGYLGIKKLLKNIKINFLSRKKNIKKNIFTKGLYYLFNNFFYLLGVDGSIGEINEFFVETEKLIISKKIDIIILSGPPFSLFYLVKRIKNRFPKIKIILDYRDGWTTRIENKIYYPLKYYMQQFHEKIILQKSDFILCATNTIYKNVKLLTKNSRKVILLTNGYSNVVNSYNINPINNRKDNKKIHIGYFGLVSDNKFSYRDINVIYNNLNRKDIFFHFFGNSIIKNSKLKNYKNFNFNSNIDYKLTLQKMRQMDYLLILHTERSTAKEVITGKFYEYLQSKIPIIVISEGETECGRLVKKLDIGYNINYLKNSLPQFFFNLNKNYKMKNNININNFSREFQNKKLIKLIN